MSRYQKGKTYLDFTEARDSEWQWHQLGHMQVCISLQTDNHSSIPPLSFFTGRMPFPLPNQQRQSTEGRLYMRATTTTTIKRPFVRDNPGRPVPEETFTHSHSSGSTCFLYHLSPFATVHGILFIQLTCLTVLSNNLFPGPLRSSHWS